jgi:NADH-quinone oxidoreductase subunit L
MWFYLVASRPSRPPSTARSSQWVYTLLENKYYMDCLQRARARRWRPRMLGTGLWKGGDQALIDGVLINGSARAVGGLAGSVTRLFQTGLPVFLRPGDAAGRVRADDLAALAAGARTVPGL